MTSEANLNFTRSTEIYDQVLTYGQIDKVAARPALIIDMAGNATLLTQLGDHLGDHLQHIKVGLSHWEGAKGLGRVLADKSETFPRPLISQNSPRPMGHLG